MAQKEKRPKYPFIDKWISKMWNMQIMKYNSAMKRNKALIGATI